MSVRCSMALLVGVLGCGSLGCGSHTGLNVPDASSDALGDDASSDGGRCGGIVCGEARFGPWGQCEFETLCATVGLRQRSVATPVCISGSCRDVEGAQTETCVRERLGLACRGSRATCDPIEVCDGVSPDCPADVVHVRGVVCRAAAGPCDRAEVCSGVDDTCPSDAFEPANAPCAGGVCSGADTMCHMP